MNTTTLHVKNVALAAENRRLRAQNAALTERLAHLQEANEGAYREAYDATGGPRLGDGTHRLRPVAGGGFTTPEQRAAWQYLASEGGAA